MNIALVGYGRMGLELREMAEARGHSIGLVIDIDNRDDLNRENLRDIDVVIEFTTPSSAPENVYKCLEMGKPVVSGTTGWIPDKEKAAGICKTSNTSFIHSSNFSIGVNILFRLNTILSGMIAEYREYSAEIEEIHHTRKLDAPSGTAITLAKGISAAHNGYSGWSAPENATPGTVTIRSVREGNVPGTHTVEWDSVIDRISIRHEAKGRKGFAMGAVMAAEYISTRKGVFTMSDVLGF